MGLEIKIKNFVFDFAFISSCTIFARKKQKTMSSNKRKWYVVWVGTEPGICDTWTECQLRTKGYQGARYKSFDNQQDAIEAWRNGYEEEARKVLRAIANAPRRKDEVDYTLIPEIIPGSWAVDAACSKNPGTMEYRGVDVYTGAQIFHQGPYQQGTNNIGEFLAIVHALALLYNRCDSTTAIYSDSRTAQIWVRKRRCGTKLERTPQNARLLDIVARAEQWLQTHTTQNPIYKWQTDKWGEIPADFGRK